MKTNPCFIDEVFGGAEALIRFCESIIKHYRGSDVPGVKELLAELEQHSSGEFADIESIARITCIYANAAEQHAMAVGTATIRGMPQPAELLWQHPKSLRILIPLKPQFDHRLAMNSANQRTEGVSDMAPVEPLNRLIATIEQSAAFGAPIVTNASNWPIRGHMVFWAVFDAQSFTGRKLLEEVQKFREWLDEATAWAQIPLHKRFEKKKSGRDRVPKHPRPSDYSPPSEYDLRYLWELDRNYIRVEQGQLFNAALPTLKLAWQCLPLLKPNAIEQMRRAAVEAEASNAN